MGDKRQPRPRRSPGQRDEETLRFMREHSRDGRLTVSARTILTLCGLQSTDVKRLREQAGLLPLRDRHA